MRISNPRPGIKPEPCDVCRDCIHCQSRHAVMDHDSGQCPACAKDRVRAERVAERATEARSAHLSDTTQEQHVHVRNPQPTSQTLATLMRDRPTAEIVCLFKKEVVRRLKVVGDQLEIDALTVTVTVPLSTPIMYEQWDMDRGSMLIELPDDGELRGPGPRWGKLCTEFDTIRYPDGSETEVRS